MNFCVRVCAFVCPGLAKGPMEHNKPVNLLLENLIQFNFFGGFNIYHCEI